MDFDLLSSLRYAKRPSGGLRVWTASALRRLGMAEALPARGALQPHNASHAQSPTGC